MPKLTQVKETKRGRYALFFDGEFAFSLDEDTFAMAGLHTGDEPVSYTHLRAHETL